jgi:hypothetical protein
MVSSARSIKSESIERGSLPTGRRQTVYQFVKRGGSVKISAPLPKQEGEPVVDMHKLLLLSGAAQILFLLY